MGDLFGGGSSSGGGASGKVDYPEYMKAWHMTMLHDVMVLIQEAGPAPNTYMYDPKVWFGIPLPGFSVYKMVAAFNSLDTLQLFKDVIGDSSVYKYILGESAVVELKGKVDAFRAEVLDAAGANAALDAMIDAHATKLMQKVNEDVLPKVEVGMRDVNAVIGSSFVIAKELAMEDYTHEIADFSAKSRYHLMEMRHDLFKTVETLHLQTAEMVANIGMKRVALEFEKLKLGVSITAEVANAAVLAQSKYGVVQTEKEIRDKTWRVDLYDHMNKTLASIAGASPTRQGESGASTVFSGAVGMAAMGAGVGSYLGSGTSVLGLAGPGGSAGGALGMAGGPAGAILGGVIGMGVGLLGGLFSGKKK